MVFIPTVVHVIQTDWADVSNVARDEWDPYQRDVVVHRLQSELFSSH